MSDSITETVLVIRLPGYFLAQSLSGKHHETINLSDDDIKIVGDLHRKVIAIFTDRPGVEEFAMTMRVKNPLIGTLATKEELIGFLRLHLEMKYERIAIDPRTKPSGTSQTRSLALADFIDALGVE